MNAAPRRHMGFTLIELMVVVTIIGIMSGLIVMNVVTSDPQKDLYREAQRLAAVIEMAQDEALFGRQDIGIIVMEDGYSFARYGIPTVAESQEEESKLSSTNKSLALDEGNNNNLQQSTSLAELAPSRIEPQWIAITDENEFRPYELSEDYSIVLEVDAEMIDITGGKEEKDPNQQDEKSKFDNDEEIRPAIFISPSNEMTPFVLEIYLKEDSDIMVKLSGDETGRVWIGDEEPL